MAVQIQLRYDTAANWSSNNPILAMAEMGVETDTLRYKLGDGVTAWNSLPYAVFDGFTSGHRYVFQDATADADPGAGNVQFNHATFGSVTQLFFDNTDASGGTATAWLDRFDDSTNASKGILRIEKLTDPDIYREFSVTGSVVDGTGYRKVPVSPLAQAGALADADPVVVNFTPAGNTGTIGAIVDGGSLDDTNGNELLKFAVTASAVNEIRVRNAATGNAPAIEASGDDTNIDLDLKPKGGGAVRFNDNALIVDAGDSTKRMRFDAGGVGGGQTRVFAMPNVDLSPSAFIAPLLAASSATAARAALSIVWEPLSARTAIGTSVSLLTVPIPAASGCSRMRLRLENAATVADDKYFYLRAGYSTGPTIDTGGNYSFAGGYSGPGGQLGIGSTTDSLNTAIALAKIGTGHGAGNAVNEVVAIDIDFTPASPDLKLFEVATRYVRPDGEVVKCQIAGLWKSTLAITAIAIGISGPTNFKDNTGYWQLLGQRD